MVLLSTPPWIRKLRIVYALHYFTSTPHMFYDFTHCRKRGVLQKLAAKLQSRETYFEGPLAPNVLAENVKDEEWVRFHIFLVGV